MVNYTTYAVVKGLNLQAWRIPLWENFAYVTKNSDKVSQPPSLENPFVGFIASSKYAVIPKSQPPSLENPFVGITNQIFSIYIYSLNLQAWRIPLWVDLRDIIRSITFTSQPPSLENPFVGDCRSQVISSILKVSTSKPGESLCGFNRLFGIVSPCL